MRAHAPSPAPPASAASPAGAHVLRVLARRATGADAVVLRFAQPSPPLRYRAGQYLTLTVEVDGLPRSRGYSLATVPGLDDHLEIAVQREPGGVVSGHLNDRLAVGDVVRASGPSGRFVLGDPPPRQVVLVGGGSGVVPLYALARAALADHPATVVSLVVGNRTPASIMFRPETAELAAGSGGRLVVEHFLDTGADEIGARPGRLTVDGAVELFADLTGRARSDTAFYLCGPPGLLRTAGAALAALGIPAGQVHTEVFTPPPAPAASGAPRSATVVGDTGDRVFPVPPGRSLLQAAEDAGLRWPSSCLAGECGDCRMRLLSGSVDMTSVDGLTEEDEAAGYVLTCVAHPTSDVRLAP